MAHSRSRNGGGLAIAVHQIVEEFPEYLERLPAALQELFWGVAVPTATGLAVLAVVGLLLHRMQRILYPPGPEALHKEAILVLQRSSSVLQNPTKLQRRRNEALIRKAVELLRQASRPRKRSTASRTKAISPSVASISEYKHVPYYAPAILSLAALYVYRLGDGNSAVQLLESTLLSPKVSSAACHVSKNDLQDARSILLDARAVLAGQGQMIQRDLRETEYLALSYCESSAVSAKSSGKSAASINSGGAVKKKQ
jgi:hypothetical protein